LSAAFDELFAAAAGAHLNSVKPGSLYEARADVTYLAGIFDIMPCARNEWTRMRPMVEGVSLELVNAVDEYLSKSSGGA
jgi:hypothetical protein